MYQPLIKFHPHPAIITQVLCIFASVVCSCAQSWNVFLIVVKKVYHKYEEGKPQLCASFFDKLSAEGRTLLCVRKTHALPNESRYFV